MLSALGDDRQMGLGNELQIDSNSTAEKVDSFLGVGRQGWGEQWHR